MRVDVVTIFPAMVEAMVAEGVIGRARAAGRVEIGVRNLRDYTDDRHRVVDDVPYGGGPGMVMKPEPFFRAIDAIGAEVGPPEAVVLLSPQGARFSQAVARQLSHLDRWVVLCGRYEGVDERVAQSVVTDEISIGDYVLTGGEPAALVVLDAVVRLVPGVVGDEVSVEEDSFSRGLLDHPHYTRPAVCRGLAVPEVLLSGHHAEIARWRAGQRVARTRTRRPDMIGSADLLDDERRALAAFEETEPDLGPDRSGNRARHGLMRRGEST